MVVFLQIRYGNGARWTPNNLHMVPYNTQNAVTFTV
jgi:hypothetical protein